MAQDLRQLLFPIGDTVIVHIDVFEVAGDVTQPRIDVGNLLLETPQQQPSGIDGFPIDAVGDLLFLHEADIDEAKQESGRQRRGDDRPHVTHSKPQASPRGSWVTSNTKICHYSTDARCQRR
ncbi:MAG: hypothetical protein IT536_21195 [Hyphomicrobiales bacterium]|nr:hypothetical protein [Hyphomicrobiales bacterium]